MRAPEETWELLAPKLTRFGITRVADVTGLDIIGIPVAVAYRPLSKTLTVSQGKGQSAVLAKVSGVMESIELWHAETAYPALAYERTAGADLALPYDVRDLPAISGSLVTAATPLAWVRAVGLVEGGASFLPFDLVCFVSPAAQRWRPAGFKLTSNGLASGNSRDEAALHALYEVIERDGISLLPGAREQIYIDPTSVDDPACAKMIEQIRRVGVQLRLIHVPNRFGVPCFAAWVWSDDFPVLTLGAGAHLAPAVALSRALTEAAQSRLTAIAGSRDDQVPIYGGVRRADHGPPALPATSINWSLFADGVAGGSLELAEDLRWVARRVTDVLGREPLLVDLSTDSEIAVVKVIAPRASLDIERMHPTRTPDFMRTEASAQEASR